MRTISKTLTLFVLIGLMVPSVFANSTQRKDCTEAEERRAIDESDRLKNWSEAYQFFKRFAHCDNGAIAEGYTESVTRLPAKDWDHLSALNNLISKDKVFEAFVLSHIDETASIENLRLIVENARSHCPLGLKSLCKSIEARAKEAVKNGST